MPVIELENVNFAYKDANPSLREINLKVMEGECLLLTGPSGCGKTTLLRLLNGLAPHYFPGELSGEIRELGQSIIGMEIPEISAHVGTVFQNPRSQFFCVDTESELAFACENRGMEETLIRRRVADTVRRFALEDLLEKSLFAMSGGQKQQIACASVDVSGPEILLLDEPSANLDYCATERLAKTIDSWKKQGKTILIADHRTAYVQEIVDRVLVMEKGQIMQEFEGAAFASMSEKRRMELHLRSGNFEDPKTMELPYDKEQAGEIQVQGLVYSFRRKLFKNADRRSRLAYAGMCFRKGEITAIVGDNGAGKTSFLRCFCGLAKETAGAIQIDGQKQKSGMRRERVFLVMQDVNHQLFTDSVAEEIRLSLPKNSDLDTAARTTEILQKMDLKEYANRHPMSLSGGQKQRVAMACAIASNREILLFDEPTSGLDYLHMRQAAEAFRKLKEEGKTILLVTHDAELIHACCDRIVKLTTVE